LLFPRCPSPLPYFVLPPIYPVISPFPPYLRLCPFFVALFLRHSLHLTPPPPSPYPPLPFIPLLPTPPTYLLLIGRPSPPHHLPPLFVVSFFAVFANPLKLPQSDKFSRSHSELMTLKHRSHLPFLFLSCAGDWSVSLLVDRESCVSAARFVVFHFLLGNKFHKYPMDLASSLTILEIHPFIFFSLLAF